MARVDYYIDGVLRVSDTAGGSHPWNTLGEVNGEHKLYAKAYDKAGELGTAAQDMYGRYIEENPLAVGAGVAVADKEEGGHVRTLRPVARPGRGDVVE